jgi:Spy/CpxP family protein refolding chaperone
MLKRLVVLAVLVSLVLMPSLIFAEEMQANKPMKQVLKSRAEQAKEWLNQLNSKLQLTPEQQAKAKDILVKTLDEIKNILLDAKAKIINARVNANNQIKALLTPEQQNIFKGMRKQSETAPEVAEQK